MYRMIVLCSFSVILLIWPAGAVSQRTPAGIYVTCVQGVKISVVLPVSLSLNDVLHQLCAKTDADCELDALSGEGDIAPMTITGSWTEVLDQLLRGSGWNYVAAANSNGLPGTLWIVSRTDKAEPNTAPVRVTGRREQETVELENKSSEIDLPLAEVQTSESVGEHPRPVSEASEAAAELETGTSSGTGSQSYSPFPEPGTESVADASPREPVDSGASTPNSVAPVRSIPQGSGSPFPLAPAPQ
jgi:hypothetical protein